jgi:hypothetical protein
VGYGFGRSTVQGHVETAMLVYPTPLHYHKNEETGKRIVPLNQAQKRVLQRAEKGRRLDERPASLATAIPRRKRGGWDENASRKKSKIETVDAAIAIASSTNENGLQEIHRANVRRGCRELATKSGGEIRSPSCNRMVLGDITNTSLRPLPRNADGIKRKRCEAEKMRLVNSNSTPGL